MNITRLFKKKKKKRFLVQLEMFPMAHKYSRRKQTIAIQAALEVPEVCFLSLNRNTRMLQYMSL